MKIVSIWVFGIISVKGLQHLIFNHSIENQFDNNNIYTLLLILTSYISPHFHISQFTNIHISIWEKFVRLYVSGHFTLLDNSLSIILLNHYNKEKNIVPNNEK